MSALTLSRDVPLGPKKLAQLPVDLISLSKHMASETVATDSSEGETEIVDITRTDTTDTATDKEPVSLLDKLRYPTESDPCRKRKVQTLKQGKHFL